MGLHAADHLREHAERCRMAATTLMDPRMAECLRGFSTAAFEQAAKLEAVALQLGYVVTGLRNGESEVT